MSLPPINPSMFLATLLAMGGPLPYSKQKKPRHSRFFCLECECAIPPGKPGRKCEQCRLKQV